jgi:hypothetical protein
MSDTVRMIVTTTYLHRSRAEDTRAFAVGIDVIHGPRDTNGSVASDALLRNTIAILIFFKAAIVAKHNETISIE